MAAIFQLRRGSGSVSLVDGELYINKGPNSLQYAVGDGTEITLAKLDELNTGSLYLKGGISASGDITASNMYVSGNVVLGGTITIGDTTNDSVIFNADLSSSIIPDATNTYDLGSTSKVYRNVYANSVSASSFTGSLFGMGDPTSFSTSVDLRLDRMEASASLYDNAMSGSKRLYVSPEGFDTNDGKDPSTPFKTIKAAVESLYPIEPSNPFSSRRYTIFVGSGNYTEQNPIVVPPGVAIVGDTLRTVRLTASNPTKDFFHVHDSNYFYGLRFLDLKYPAFAFSFPSSTATGSISAGGISSIGVVHSMTGYTDGNNQDLGIVIEGPDASGSITTATANVVGGVITQINVVNAGTNYVSGEKPHISIPAPLSQRPVITTSPYVQNCSSITGPFNTSGVKVLQALPYDEATFNIDEQGAGGGIRIDGNLVHPTESPLESFVADAFTQVNQGGPGHLVINKGYAQFVSCFTTFCTYGFKVANGGFANVSNSVIDFGKYGLISKTYFPNTYNTATSSVDLTSYLAAIQLDENGAGYTGSIAGVTIFGGGASIQAIATASVDANGSIREIVITNSGSGYTSKPTVEIDAPTGAGAIQATTLFDKGEISNIGQIPVKVTDITRGIDISSNMVLNGQNYLVVDVSGSGDDRLVSILNTEFHPAPASITSGSILNFHQLSNISTGNIVMEYVGSGVTYNALPKFGGIPLRTREINEFAPGRVFYTSVDNIGNLKIGDYFSVNQLTGEVSITSDSFNLTGLNAIGPFKRNGFDAGVILQEVSNNTNLLNSVGLYGEDTVPTQFAVKGYIDIRDAKLNKLEISSASVNTFSSSALVRLSNLETTSGSHNVRLSNLESKSASVDISVTNLNSYTHSLNQAIQLTGSTVSFLGNIVVYGTQSIINSENLAVADNLIYLNNDSFVTNPDLGIVGNYNDGTYAHTGIFRDASDGVWRVFKGYVPEPSGNIDLSDPSYQYADFYANALSASTLSGIGNITLYSTSVNSRLIELETKSGSIDNSILILNQFSASVTSSLEKIYQTTSSLNSATASLYTSASLMTASIASLNTSVVTLQSFSGNVNTKFDRLQTYTTSVDSRFATLRTYTASVNETTASLNAFTESTNTILGLLEISTGSLNTFSSSTLSRLGLLETSTGSLNSFSTSVVSSLLSIYQTTSSLNQFTASVTASLLIMTASIDDHEDRITYVEGTLGITGGNPLVPLNAFSASAKISIANLEAATGSYETNGRGIVSGSTQVTPLLPTGVISGSSQILGGSGLVSGSSQITYANISSIPSGIVSGSSQLNGTTITNLTITNLTTVNQTASVLFSSGSNKFGDFSNDTHDFTGSVKISGSIVTIGASTATSFNGTINATNGVVSGSSQITGITNAQLNNSTISGITLGSNLATLTIGTGLSGTSYNGSGAVTIANTGVTSNVAGTGITVSGATGAVTISIGQSVATSASPTFAGLSINGAITATGNISAYVSSDRRLKNNIVPIGNALTKLNKIGGYSFDWTDDYIEKESNGKGEDGYFFRKHDIGVIAQELQEILPEAVAEKTDGYLGVRYEKIIPLLIQSIKELQLEINELKNSK
jgi:hypothetical protein